MGGHSIRLPDHRRSSALSLRAGVTCTCPDGGGGCALDSWQRSGESGIATSAREDRFRLAVFGVEALPEDLP